VQNFFRANIFGKEGEGSLYIECGAYAYCLSSYGLMRLKSAVLEKIKYDI